MYVCLCVCMCVCLCVAEYILVLISVYPMKFPCICFVLLQTINSNFRTRNYLPDEDKCCCWCDRLATFNMVPQVCISPVCVYSLNVSIYCNHSIKRLSSHNLTFAPERSRNRVRNLHWKSTYISTCITEDGCICTSTFMRTPCTVHIAINVLSGDQKYTQAHTYIQKHEYVLSVKHSYKPIYFLTQTNEYYERKPKGT